MDTITANTNVIGITYKGHHARTDSSEYVFEHYFEFDGETFHVYLEYCDQNDEVYGSVCRVRKGKEADLYGRNQLLYSIRKSNGCATFYEEVEPSLQPLLDDSVIKVTKACNKLDDKKLQKKYVVRLFRIGEFLMRNCWKDKTVVVNYGTANNTLSFDESLESKYSSVHNEDTCMCFSCHNSRYLRKYSGGNHSRALSPSSCGGYSDSAWEGFASSEYGSTESTGRRSGWGSGAYGRSSYMEEAKLRRGWEESVKRGEAKCGCGQCPLC